VVDPSSLLGRALRRVGTTRFARTFLGPKVLPHVDRWLHRVTGGRVVASDLLFDTVMLTTTGRRSGQPRTTPLARLELDGTPVVIASNFGRPSHPAWSLNLLADPQATVEEAGHARAVVARRLDATEEERVWPQAVALWPGYATYRQTTEGLRDIRMFALEPRHE
jgi:deazaflavin-dependent oxidoreductase (nitroreductase family)